jgi:hypothetical protein
MLDNPATFLKYNLRRFPFRPLLITLRNFVYLFGMNIKD